MIGDIEILIDKNSIMRENIKQNNINIIESEERKIKF
jgi:hypothetical protein